MSLINCEVSLTLIWSENCVLIRKATIDDDPDVENTWFWNNNFNNFK